jgi:carboxylesterase type B
MGSGEDCLYLHVHVPVAEAGEEPLAVMVWLTGGAFLVGGGYMYGPELWMAHRVIIVTVNYRMGPAGFLTLGTDEAGPSPS